MRTTVPSQRVCFYMWKFLLCAANEAQSSAFAERERENPGWSQGFELRAQLCFPDSLGEADTAKGSPMRAHPTRRVLCQGCVSLLLFSPHPAL